MKLLKIEIKNLKSITNAKLVFPSNEKHQVSLLYGDNGAGKTTILEAISLLGHISTMRRIQVADGKVVQLPSIFRESKQQQMDDAAGGLRNLGHEQYDETAFADQLDLIRGAGLQAWWSSTPVTGDPHRPARMRYTVHFGGAPIEFYISFLQNRQLSITEALSREQKSPGEKIHDGNMDNFFAIVCDETNRKGVECLVAHMLAMSPHSYWSMAPAYTTDPRATARAEGHSMVAYWNTDLNDFGRKNDLRESVKKIRLDFVDQMIGRLGLALPYGESTNPEYHAMSDSEIVTSEKLVRLNDSLKRALVDHAVALKGEHEKLNKGLIQITAIDATTSPASMKARRASESKDIEIDHLSAGENEAVFIFLLMHGMPCRDSIILLDEPELHLSDFAKPSFYKELYRVAQAAGCQLIISTHSALAYAAAGAGRSHHFLRRVPVVDHDGVRTMVYKTSWDDSFGELLTFHYLRCAVNSMCEAGLTWKILSYPMRAYIGIGESYLGRWGWTFVTCVGAGVLLYALIAVVNDAFFAVDKITGDDHQWVIRGAAALCAVAVALLITLRTLLKLMPKH